MVAPRLRSGRKRKKFSASLRVTWRLVGRHGDHGRRELAVVARPMVLRAPGLTRFRPSSVVLLRSTMANCTFRRICVLMSGTSTYSRLTTLPTAEAIASGALAHWSDP